MATDKELKNAFKQTASQTPDLYYPVSLLSKLGFERKQCSVTKMFFWTMDPTQTVCGEPQVQGGYSFIGNPPTKQPIAYIDVWTKFADFFSKRGYKQIPRKPVVARWRNDVYWVAASVYPFQPYVVRGEIKPPHNKVTIAQPSFRFNDIDNVGITGSHYTGFIMLGQLCFEPKESYKQDEYFMDYYEWITSKEGMGIPPQTLTLHEDAWAGGGTFGPCIEFFCGGMEIGNQVYMMFELDDEGNQKELSIKVLDMGQGMERVPWLTSGTSTSYDTTFPTVMKYLYATTNVVKNEAMLTAFLPWAGTLNIDELDDVDGVWESVAKRIGYDVTELRTHIEMLSALYSIADHTRSALFGLADGAVPSNVGGAYNMRIIIRRALHLIEKYGWDIDIMRVVALHAEYLQPLYPELVTLVADVQHILQSEIDKFKSNRVKSQLYIERLAKKSFISQEDLLEAYDSHGINPDEIKRVKDILVPSDFYALVGERHDKQTQLTATKKSVRVHIPDTVPSTHIAYFDDYLYVEHNATVVWSQAMNQSLTNADVGDDKLFYVVLDSTNFYPTSGGQIHDVGTINGCEVIDVFKQDNYIVHVVRGFVDMGAHAHCIVDKQRRIQVSAHHTAVHIVNTAVRQLLGHHINQAGASKDVDKARLDITHYENIDDALLKKIQTRANEIVASNLSVTHDIMPREDAEEKYTMHIYQGGFIPGRNLRIVHIGDIDHQACGGTHVYRTGDVEHIHFLGSSRVQDGVVRLQFVAGNVAREHTQKQGDVLADIAQLLGVQEQYMPSRAQQVFTLWKQAKKGKLANVSFSEDVAFTGDVLVETARILKTQPEHVYKTLKRFLDDITSSLQKKN